MLKFFKCVPKSDVSQLHSDLVCMLNAISNRIGKDLIINSAFRSLEWEKSKGRSGTSSHCKGLAVDVSCLDSGTRFQIIDAAIDAGVFRIGIGKTFIHLDIDSSKRHPIIFHYYE